MTEFIVSIFIFVVAHLIPPIPSIRQRLINILGRRIYLIGYSILSLALLTWVISASRRASFFLLWEPASWQAMVAVIGMPLSFWFILAGLAEANLLSISLRRPKPAVSLPPIVTITRHPVLWGFTIWTATHVPPNGDAVSILLFATLTALAIAGFPLLDRRARRRLGNEKWIEMSRSTSVVPFAAILTGKGKIRVDAAFMLQTGAAIGVYFWFLFQGHKILIGPSPLLWIS